MYIDIAIGLRVAVATGFIALFSHSQLRVEI